MFEITWADALRFGSDLKSEGHCGSSVFVIRFFRTATGRSISLAHNGEFVGAFRTVGAAKRRAKQIVKGMSAASA